MKPNDSAEQFWMPWKAWMWASRSMMNWDSLYYVIPDSSTSFPPPLIWQNPAYSIAKFIKLLAAPLIPDPKGEVLNVRAGLPTGRPHISAFVAAL